MSGPRTLFDRIWDAHVVVDRGDGWQLLYVDRHLMHDGSGPAFERLRERGLPVRRPDLALATPDHYTSTASRDTATIADPVQRAHVEGMRANTSNAGVRLFFGVDDVRQGIAHVVSPEQGFTQPGMTLVCGDSHTATHGALGALAFGIGSSEVTHVMATQCLWQRKPKAMRVTVDGALAAGVTAKDVVLAIIARIGAAGGVGHVIEYAGSAIRALSVEGRLTVCNMSIEAGARAGMVAPDDVTYAYLHGRPLAPSGDAWDRALARWRALPTDADARFDREVSIDAASIEPMVTWGTSPEDAVSIAGVVPDPSQAPDAAKRDAMRVSLDYMGLVPGTRLEDVAVDRVFIGSCTNSRIEDLRAAAAVARGRKAVVPAWVVPGSGLVKAQAEAEGLDRVFREAGFDWREPGCSMCVGMNGDTGLPGQRIASTSNRNFMGRQGRGVRTHLLGPAMAAAAAVTGRFTDVRRLAAQGA
ncbi:MAG: 3-isopropylmalate dehydratase large subunit [Burkholderiales bacterium]|jgi:3-isopropylmalate/(R)-2-methylmalate dehydratase large subunit